MIYNRANFVDTSQILNKYAVYQESEKSPLVLQPKFIQPNFGKRETPKSLPVYRQREANWQDSFASVVEKQIRDLFSNFLSKWENPLSQLKAFVEDEVNPALEKPSSHSVFMAFNYLFAVYQLQPESCPELAVSGDGGIYLEWQLNDKFVSIQVDREKSDNDRIYVEQADGYGSTKITEDTLEKVFSK